MKTDENQPETKTTGATARVDVKRLVSRISFWKAFFAVLIVMTWYNAAIVLRVNHIGLVVKQPDTFIPEFLSKD